MSSFGFLRMSFLSGLALAPFGLLSLHVAGCSDDSTNTTPADAGSDVAADTNVGPDTGADTGNTEASGGTPKLALIKNFDPSKFELPESLVIHDNNFYMSLAIAYKVIKLSADGQTQTDFVQMPQGDPNKSSLISGVEFDKAGNLYVGYVAFDPTQPAPGLYKVAAGTTTPVLYASGADLQFPNGICIDDATGNIYLTNSVAGNIYKIVPNPDGGAPTATVWLTAPELIGDEKLCSGHNPFPLGANGISARPAADGTIYINSTDKGLLLKANINDATPHVTVVAGAPGSCELHGADGLGYDDANKIVYMALNANNAVARVELNNGNKVTKIFSGSPLDFSSDVRLGTINNTPGVYMINFALLTLQTGGSPKPSLYRIDNPML